MKVLLINGSPKEKGCTWTALSEVEKVLKEEDIETEIFHIGNKAVQGCAACGKCADLGKCVFDDIVNVLLEKSKKADSFIFGSPVYYASANGSLIALMDRLFYAGAFYADGKTFALKPAAAVVCARRAGTTAALDQINKYFAINAMPQIPSQYWNMLHGAKPEDAAKDLEGLQIMRTLARNTAWLLKSIEAGKKSGVALPKREETRYRTNFIR
ncbi:MAG: flavodoxin family protein [Endomicrobium sp.]|jgi:multimeric flavodoxin WrbA|nr:flavodoxin family protein [Endomicrobium sp.]